MEHKRNNKDPFELHPEELSNIYKEMREEIIKRKQAEADLRLSEEKFYKAFYFNPDPISITVVKDSCYVDVNDAWLKIAGYERHEVIGRSTLEIGLWNILEERELILEKIRKNGIVRNFEAKLCAKNGKIVTVILSADQLDMGGEPHLLCIAKDITEQRTMEEKLRIRDTELRSIFENANGIIYTLSPQGEFIFISRGWTETMGHESSAIIGQSFESYVHPEDIPRCNVFLQKVLATGETINGVEYRIKHIDGTWRWHTSSGVPVKDEAGHYIYVVGLAVDITERKQAEMALSISEEKFSKAFHCIPDPIAITDLEEGRYIEINDAFIAVSGYQRHEVIGHTGAELGIWLTPEVREQVVDLIKKFGNIRDFEIKSRVKCGEIRDFLLSAEIINMAGEQKILYAVKDITERKTIEEALRLSE